MRIWEHYVPRTEQTSVLVFLMKPALAGVLSMYCLCNIFDSVITRVALKQISISGHAC